MTKTTKRDPEWTTRCFLIEQHYASIADSLSWDVNRFQRLCAAMQLTPVELGAYLRTPPNLIRRYLADNHFPKPIELHLTLIERALFPSDKPSVFPPL